MNRINPIVGALLLWLATWAVTSAAEPGRYALLVGCTKYPDREACPTLMGPANDVPLWNRLLTAESPQGFSFPSENVTVLLGEANSTGTSPTRANILRELDQLIAKAESDVQIFILLTGHGTQQPIPDTDDPFDPQDPEPDGMDEVFLPADAKPGDNGIENGLVDDELGYQLDKMRAKGAFVFIVFDCCHSGSMTRGPSGEEQNRFIPFNKTGVSAEKIAATVARAEKSARAKDPNHEPVDQQSLDLSGKTASSRKGGLVAFFAAQPFEPAPELPLPLGAQNIPANKYGLLSYSLVETLSQQHRPMSYRALARVLAAQYRKIRGTRFPTPFAEGDLDYEVLGVEKWPIQGELFLRALDDDYSISVGALHGMTPGAVLAVYDDAKMLQGHVRVVSTTPSISIVMPVAWQSSTVQDKLPDNATCRVVYREYGDLRIKVYCDDDARKALEQLSEEFRAKVQIVNQREAARWWLERTTPELAHRLGIKVPEKDRFYLLPGDALLTSSMSVATKDVAPLRPTSLRVFGDYATDDKTLAAGLERDLPRIFTWENLWRASSDQSTRQQDDQAVVVDAQVHKHEGDRVGEQLVHRRVKSGQRLEFIIRNTGPRKMWVSAFYLDANLGIKQMVTPRLIQPQRALEPLVLQMVTEGASVGHEGLLVFAEPAGTSKDNPDYSILEQEPLQVKAVPNRSIADLPNTPFGELMKLVALGNGVRGEQVGSGEAPTVISHTWLLTE